MGTRQKGLGRVVEVNSFSRVCAFVDEDQIERLLLLRSLREQ